MRQKSSTPIKRSIKHVYTTEERAQLSGDLVVALGNVDQANGEFDSMKATFKAKIEESESRVTTIATSLRAGFEMRLEECEVYFLMPEKKKEIVHIASKEIVATEDMTPADMQTDLELCESAFESRKEIALWPDAGTDRGTLVVGKQRNRWYSAIRLTVGNRRIDERLDSEQKGFKERHDAVTVASTRATLWLKDNFKDAAKGFHDSIAKAVTDENA